MRQLRGFLFVMASAVLFGFVPLFTKVVIANGCTSSGLVFYRFLFALPFLFVLLQRQAPSFRPTAKIMKKVGLLSIGYCSTPFLLTFSYLYIPSGLSTTIHFTYPIFVLIGCVVFFHERLSRAKILCAALCIAGILLCYTPGDSGAAIGLALAFASGITYAFYMVYLDHSGLSEVPSFALGFLLASTAAVISFFAALADGGLFFSMTPFGWFVLLIASFNSSVAALMLFQVGVQIVGAQRAAILSTLEPITSIAIGVLFLSEPFSLKSLLGAALVLAAVVLLVIFDNEKTAPAETDDSENSENQV